MAIPQPVDKNTNTASVTLQPLLGVWSKFLLYSPGVPYVISCGPDSAIRYYLLTTDLPIYNCAGWLPLFGGEAIPLTQVEESPGHVLFPPGIFNAGESVTGAYQYFHVLGGALALKTQDAGTTYDTYTEHARAYGYEFGIGRGDLCNVNTGDHGAGAYDADNLVSSAMWAFGYTRRGVTYTVTHKGASAIYAPYTYGITIESDYLGEAFTYFPRSAAGATLLADTTDSGSVKYGMTASQYAAYPYSVGYSWTSYTGSSGVAGTLLSMNSYQHLHYIESGHWDSGSGVYVQDSYVERDAPEFTTLVLSMQDPDYYSNSAHNPSLSSGDYIYSSAYTVDGSVHSSDFARMFIMYNEMIVQSGFQQEPAATYAPQELDGAPPLTNTFLRTQGKYRVRYSTGFNVPTTPELPIPIEEYVSPNGYAQYTDYTISYNFGGGNMMGVRQKLWFTVEGAGTPGVDREHRYDTTDVVMTTDYGVSWSVIEPVSYKHTWAIIGG